MIATVTIQGLYRFNNHLFDGLTVPEGVVKNDAIGAILRTVADLPSLYADPGFLQEYIENWAKTRLETWTKIYEALTAEYNPFEDYGTTERGSLSRDAGRTRDRDSNEYVQGFETSKGLTNSGKVSEGIDESEDENREYESEKSGNSGRHTKQEALVAEIEMRNSFNIYEYIANDFKQNFCLQIY